MASILSHRCCVHSCFLIHTIVENSYLDDLLDIDNTYFDDRVGQIYPSEPQSNKASSSDIEAPFLDLHLPISVGFVSSSKIYDKRDDVDFVIVIFHS